MKLLQSTENKITKDKDGENVPDLEITEVVLVHYNIVNVYQWDSRVSYTFVPNKPFGNLWEIAPTNFIHLKTFNSEFQTIEVWFTDQNSQPLEIKDKINLTLWITFKNRWEWYRYTKRKIWISRKKTTNYWWIV